MGSESGFARYTVVRVPFPFTDRNTNKHRPALVLPDAFAFNTPSEHSVMAMMFTLDHRLVRSELGHLAQSDIALVRVGLVKLLGI